MECTPKYSDQANVMISNLKDFDREIFETWFFSKLIIGSNNILEYLIYKESLRPKIAIPIGGIK